MVPFLITHGLAIIQIRMPFQLLVIMRDAGLPESHITMNSQKEPFDRDGKATAAMSWAVALSLIPKTNCGFFSRSMANSWVSWCWGFEDYIISIN
jgi:hypothetical protein